MKKILPILIIAGAVVALAFVTKRGKIMLTAGWNEVVYTGKRQKAGVAMQSLADYMEIAYYYDAFAVTWKQIIYDTMLEPGMIVNIKVIEDCVWTF